MTDPRSPRGFDAPVDGGLLHGAQWGADDAPPLLAVHGVTSHHLAWAHVAAALPEWRVVAPDLRGRGGSADLPGPWGMARHADDVVAVLDHLGLDRVPIVGHSMGAFVAAAAAHRHPDRISRVILVDGGLPLELPPGVDASQVDALLGPALARLSMTFADRDEYREFWRAHPAFIIEPPVDLDGYADYDLAGTAPVLRPRPAVEAVRTDARELYGAPVVVASLAALDGAILLTAPRGLQDETPGLYPPAVIERYRTQLPGLTIEEVADVNHYTIVMGERGAAAVAEVVRRLGEGAPQG